MYIIYVLIITLGVLALLVSNRAVKFLLAAALIVPIYSALVDLRGWPMPTELEWFRAQDDAAVIASDMREGVGIYLWLRVDGQVEPRAYVMPWTEEMAKQLDKAMQEAAKNQTGVRIRLPFEHSYDNREPKFYATPQPALPQKPAPAGEAEVYEQPGENA